MPDRRRRIVLLIATRHDGLYLPAGSLTTAAGFVPVELEPCVTCGGVMLRDDFGGEIRRRKGRGFVLDRYGRRRPCTGCGGRVDDRGRWWGGEVARDPMDATGARVGSAATVATARPRRTVKCDACDGDGVRYGDRCVYCDGQGRRDVHLFELAYQAGDDDSESSGDPLTDAVDARNLSGSYHELDTALALLREHDWVAHATLVATIDEGAVLNGVHERALSFVDALMPADIRVPAAVRLNERELRQARLRARGRASDARALVARDAEIRGLIRQGKPTQWVAREFGLSVRRVNAIMGGEAA